jgi:hypothetical protein
MGMAPFSRFHTFMRSNGLVSEHDWANREFRIYHYLGSGRVHVYTLHEDIAYSEEFNDDVKNQILERVGFYELFG